MDQGSHIQAQYRAEFRPRVVKTPVHNIPIGEPVQNNEGRLGLRLKKPGEPVYEIVWLDQVTGMVVKEVAVRG